MDARCWLIPIMFCLTTAAVAGDAPDAQPFPTPPTKKGLQVQMLDDALSLGIHHAALNVDLTRLIDPSDNRDSLTWTLGDRRFAFSRQRVADLDSQVKSLSSQGVVVYLILLPYASGEPSRDRVMLHPSYARGAPQAGPIGMFNTVTPEGREWLTAAAEFLADRYRGGDQGRVWGYIAGNEINSHWFWANMGRVRPEEVIQAYEQAVRIIHGAVRRHSLYARTYISLEHCWATRYAGGDETQAIPGREFLEAFAKRVREGGDFDWHLAYHPYPEPLTDCRFWLDRRHSRQSLDAPVVTFRNLEVLVDFMARDELRYEGQPRRIIFSEQGFHCSNRRQGEQEQAAAYALAYMKVAEIDQVDAFILHRHVDHAHEGGLRLGLWTNKPGSIATPDRPRKMYEVFKAAGTDRQPQVFQFALPILGAKSWDEALEDLKE